MAACHACKAPCARAAHQRAFLHAGCQLPCPPAAPAALLRPFGATKNVSDTHRTNGAAVQTSAGTRIATHLAPRCYGLQLHDARTQRSVASCDEVSSHHDPCISRRLALCSCGTRPRVRPCSRAARSPSRGAARASQGYVAALLLRGIPLRGAAAGQACPRVAEHTQRGGAALSDVQASGGGVATAAPRDKAGLTAGLP